MAEQQAHIESLEDRIKQLNEQLKATKSHLRRTQAENAALKSKYATELRESQREVDQLKKTRQTLKPLVDVGVTIRLRFLEQAKGTLEAGNKVKSQFMVSDGNITAYGGNGIADTALFIAGFLSDTDPLMTVFEKICKVSTTAYSVFAVSSKRCLDSDVTRRSSRKIDDCVPNADLQKIHHDLCRVTFKAWNDKKRLVMDKGYKGLVSLGYAAKCYDEELNNWIIMDRLEWLTEELLNFDKQKSMKRWNSLPVSLSCRTLLLYSLTHSIEFANLHWRTFQDFLYFSSSWASYER